MVALASIINSYCEKYMCSHKHMYTRLFIWDSELIGLLVLTDIWINTVLHTPFQKSLLNNRDYVIQNTSHQVSLPCEDLQTSEKQEVIYCSVVERVRLLYKSCLCCRIRGKCHTLSHKFLPALQSIAMATPYPVATLPHHLITSFW